VRNENGRTHRYALRAGAYGEPESTPFDKPLAAPGVSEPMILSEGLRP